MQLKLLTRSVWPRSDILLNAAINSERTKHHTGYPSVRSQICIWNIRIQASELTTRSRVHRSLLFLCEIRMFSATRPEHTYVCVLLMLSQTIVPIFWGECDSIYLKSTRHYNPKKQHRQLSWSENLKYKIQHEFRIPPMFAIRPTYLMLCNLKTLIIIRC